MIANKLQTMIGEALKAHDAVRLSTLRLLSSEFNYEKIAKQHELDDSEELLVIRREAKKRKESAEAYEKANLKERAEKELEELKILQEFLPTEMSDSDLEKIVEQAIKETNASNISEMGKVIGLVKVKTSGNVDGGKVAALVKSKLNG